MKLIAYHGKQAEKDAILAQLEAHAAADEIVKGQYWNNGKGCAVACTIHSDRHVEYESRFGIPETLAHLEDCIFEALLNDTAKAWPQRFMRAIPVGADLSMVWPRFALWMLREEVSKTTKEDRVLAAIEGVAELYEKWVDGNKPAQSRWAAAWAAWAARAAWAAWAARAARAAAGDAAGAARDAFWKRAANKLIELIKSTKEQ